ncbi:MAG: hypothetical protein JNK85_02275 [Verrucomicrobiales bacterium]|nr:hypothetical protein [Verrucomicrobiales bacterium]
MELRTDLSALRRIPIFLLFALAIVGGGGPSLAAAARPGTARTSGGQTHQGNVALVPDGVQVQPAAGDPVTVPLDQLLELSFAGPGSADSNESLPAAAERPPAPKLASGWAGASIGTAPAGKVSEEPDGAWRITGGGRGMQGNADACYVAQRPLELSGQVVAKLESFDGTSPESLAGLILRDNLGEAAAYAFVGHRPGSGIVFLYRQIASGMTMRFTNVTQTLPVWLRLGRVGGAVVAEVSGDGLQWDGLGRGNVNLGQNVRAGMVVTSGSETGLVSAVFRSPTVGAKGLGYIPASGFPRLHFRGGSVLVSPIESADESVIRLGGAMRGALVSVLNLARIDFVPVSPDLEQRLDVLRPGLLLLDGDFLDGSMRGFSTNTLTMSSLLFGFRKFAAGSEAGVLQIAAVEAEDAPFRVVLQNGSELRARRLEFGKESLRVESPLLGMLQIGAEHLKQVRRSGPDR